MRWRRSRYIRESMDAAGSVAVPGSAGIAMGSRRIGCNGAVADDRISRALVCHLGGRRADRRACGRTLMTRSASVVFFIGSGKPGRKLLLGLMPCLFAGAVMTAVLWKANYIGAAPGNLAAVVWMCADLRQHFHENDRDLDGRRASSRLVCSRSVAPAASQIPLLGLGFGGLHIVFGILIARDAHGRQS